MVTIYRGDAVPETESPEDLILNKLCDVFGGAVQQNIAEAVLDLAKATSYILVPVALLQLPKSCFQYLAAEPRAAIELFVETQEAKARLAKEAAANDPPAN